MYNVNVSCMHINTDMHDTIIYIISNFSLYVQVQHMSAYEKSNCSMWVSGWLNSDYVNINL